MLQGTVEPSQIDAMVEEGRALIQGGNAKEAVQCFVKAAEADPTNAKVWNDLGVALFITEQIQPAIEAFESAIRYDEKFADAYINLATAASKTGDDELTHNTLNQAMQALPDNGEIRAVCRDLAGFKGTPQTVTEAAPETATPETPITDPVQEHIVAGRELVQRGCFDEACQSFLKALELEPTCAPAWNDLGVAMYSSGQIDGAFEAFETCLTHDSSFADAAINMVTAAQKLGRTSNAIVALQGVLAIDPTNAEARSALTKLEQTVQPEAEDTGEAERQTKALELMHEGRESLGTDNYAEAGRKFLEATEVAPGFAPPWNDLGVALYLEEHNDLAYQAFETALQLAPGFVDAALNGAKCAKRVGRQDDGRKFLENALVRNPDDADLTQALAELTGQQETTIVEPAGVQTPDVDVQVPASDVAAANALEAELLKGRELLQAGQIQEACHAFLTAIEMDLTCAISWNDLGVALYQGGNIESSIEAFETAMMHEPTMTDAPINLANALQRLGQADAAINVLQTAMIRCPDDNDLRKTYDAFTNPAPVQAPAASGQLDFTVAGQTFVAIDVDPSRANARVAAAQKEGATRAEMFTPTAIRDGLIGGQQIGQTGVVYCGEVIERVPNPAQTLSILRQIATDTVVLTTRCVPEIINASVGSIQFTDDAACFVPAAGDVAKSILEAYEAEQGRSVEYINGTAVEGGWLLGSHEEPNAVWWAWTDDFVQKMIETAGFSVIQQQDTPDKGVKAFICRVR